MITLNDGEIAQIMHGIDIITAIISFAQGKQDYHEDRRSKFRLIVNEKSSPGETEEERIKEVLSEQSNDGANLKFTEKEILKMPIRFRKEIRTNGLRAHVRKRKRGHSLTFEIRCRSQGYNISAGGKTLEEAKENFIAKLKAIDTGEPITTSYPTTFDGFFTFYEENYRKRKVRPYTVKGDYSLYKNHIFPHFGTMKLKSITPYFCQQLIDKITDEGKEKTADDIFTLLNGFFKYAVAHDIITKNPMATVFHEQHERVHGVALTKSEEAKLLSVQDESLRISFALALYLGLRPCEYNSIRREGKIIISLNRKRKTKKPEYKRIPINPMLAPHIGDLQTFQMHSPHQLRRRIKELLPNHILYDLRTTFYTRCMEMHVDKSVLKEMAGHSEGALADTYTDFSDEYLISESNKIKYDLPPILPPI